MVVERRESERILVDEDCIIFIRGRKHLSFGGVFNGSTRN